MVQPTANDWSRALQDARKALRLSRAALGQLAGVSAQTIKAYELGLRHPTRPLLLALFDALKLDRMSRDQILHAAGYSGIGADIGPASEANYSYTVEQAAEHIEGLPWPAFVVDDLLQVAAANTKTECLWGLRLADYPDQASRNMVQFAALPRFVERLTNWDEMVAVAISVFKGHHLGRETLESPSPYFRQVLEKFMEGDPRHVQRFFAAWETTQPVEPKVRWGYPVVWKEPEIGEMRFQATVTTANDPQGLAFNDWIPVDAESWQNLETVISRCGSKRKSA